MRWFCSLDESAVQQPPALFRDLQQEQNAYPVETGEYILSDFWNCNHAGPQNRPSRRPRSAGMKPIKKVNKSCFFMKSKLNITNF